MKRKIFSFFFALLFGIGLMSPVIQPTSVYAKEPEQIVQVEQAENLEANHNNTSSGMIETDDAYDPFEGMKQGDDWTTFELKTPPGLSPKDIFKGTGVLGWISNWITYQAVLVMQFVARLAGDITTIDANGYFTEPAMYTMQMFFYYLALFCLAVGIVFSVVDTAVQYQNGSGNVGSTVSGIIKAMAFTLGFTVIIPTFYRAAVDASLVIQGTGVGEAVGNAVRMFFNPVVLSIAITNGPTMFVISLILVLIFLFMYVKHLYAICKRALVLLSFMAKGSVIPFALARNSTSSFTSFAKEFIMFLLACILQEWAFYEGLAYLGSAKLLIGFALITCSNEVFSYLGTVRADGDNVMRDIHDIVCTASNVGNVAGKVVRGVATGGASVAADAAGAVTSAATSAASAD